MKKRDYTDYLQDIIASIEEVESFAKDLTFEDFAGDRKTINAVTRSLEVIGEAAKKIPTSVKSRYASVPWKKMASMRDKLIHEYFGVDVEILWKVATEEIPALKPFIQDVIKGKNK